MIWVEVGSWSFRFGILGEDFGFVLGYEVGVGVEVDLIFGLY